MVAPKSSLVTKSKLSGIFALFVLSVILVGVSFSFTIFVGLNNLWVYSVQLPSVPG